MDKIITLINVLDELGLENFNPIYMGGEIFGLQIDAPIYEEGCEEVIGHGFVSLFVDDEDDKLYAEMYTSVEG